MNAKCLGVMLLVVSLATGGCTSLFVRPPPTEAELNSAALLKSCPLGVPATRARIVDTTDGVDVSFSTSMSGVEELRSRVRDQARSNGPNRHVGSGHGGRHVGYHDHGLQLWSMGAVRATVEDTPNGARLGIVPVDRARRDEVRKLVIERVAYLEAQGCHE